ncbi:MAG: GNAT family N-acetyltransferase [Candidatus Bathyarchaeia archaeon]
MQYKTVTLKNGQTASLSWLEQADLAEVVEALNSVIREQKYLLIVNEISDLESEHRWFAEEIDLGMRYLVARVDGKVVGGASLTPLPGKRGHIAEYGIYVIDSQRNLGLGTLMTKAFVEIARKSHFEIIQLSVFSNNKRAMHIYGKCGFKKCGKLKHDVKFTDGTYTDRILMEQPLPR